MIAAVSVLCALLGVPVGSVLNVVIDRVPEHVPLRGPQPAEPCPPESWLGIPAQPWLFRLGRSASGDELPGRWLWVELTTAGLWALMAARYGDSATVLPLLVLAASLVAVSVIDLQLLRIPDRVTFPALALSGALIVIISAGRDEAGGDCGRVVRPRGLLRAAAGSSPHPPEGHWGSAT